MNAMFAIDDNKDADTDEFHQQTTQEKPKRTYSRKTATQPADKYSGIKAALQSTTSTAALLSLYNQHRSVVEETPEIKALFTLRKQELQAA